ncbi:response regulator transcription factor [Rugosimonospora africana]|uniref:DNA-binding response regulator n=1 Tax=Rugosimonospora africana TaxID=556532 RepID=A0A8J3VTD7_9ACTN|nr:response regulator transcription factor [Rugosimonospora africana]GIH18085.1 DNA-binding response regulator [Rugosimonospora africana]
MSAVRVVVADDQAAVREGLVALLGLLPGIEVVAEAADGPAALAAVARHRPDVVLLDLRMPGMDGIATTAQLSADHPATAVVILTSYADDGSVLAALAAGARGYLTKNAGRAEIGQAVTAAAAGLGALDPTVQERLVRAARIGQVPAELPDGLTTREAEVLALIAAGLSNHAIATRLRIEPATVKSHINRIFTKTGAEDRPGAIDYARRHGMSA